MGVEGRCVRVVVKVACVLHLVAHGVLLEQAGGSSGGPGWDRVGEGA